MTWLDEQRSESAQLRADFAELRNEMARTETRLLTGFTARVTASEIRMLDRMGKVETTLVKQISEVKSDLMKWSFVFWCGAVASVAALAGVLR